MPTADDGAQKRGEIAKQGKPSSAEGLPTTEDIGLTHKDIHEASSSALGILVVFGLLALLFLAAAK